MKYSNTDLCNSVKAIVAQTILPNLATPESRMAAVAIITAVDELIKRDQSTAALLTGLLPQGRVIAQRIVALLTELGLDASAVVAQPGNNLQSGIAALAGEHNLLLHIMETGCVTLHEATAEFPEREPAIQALMDEAGKWELAYFAGQSAPVAAVAAIKTGPGLLTAEKLQGFLTATLPERHNIAVTGFENVPGGMSKQTYFFTLSDDTGSEQLVVRKASDAQLLDLGCLNIKREYYLLKDVHAAGFLCPEPLWLADQPADTDGSYFIMRKSPGKSVGSFFGADNALPEGLMLHLAETFARLHAIPMAHFAPNIGLYSEPRYIDATVEQALRYNFDGFYKFWQGLDRLPAPFEVRTLHWLSQNIPRNDNPAVLTHNDLMVHNFLAEGDRISAVLDWEGSMFGDPASDLGYVKVEVSKHIEWKRFLAHYHAHGGQPIDESAFAFHETLTNLRNLAGTNKHTMTIKAGRGDPKDILLAYNYVPVFMDIIDQNIAGTR